MEAKKFEAEGAEMQSSGNANLKPRNTSRRLSRLAAAIAPIKRMTERQDERDVAASKKFTTNEKNMAASKKKSDEAGSVVW